MTTDTFKTFARSLTSPAEHAAGIVPSDAEALPHVFDRLWRGRADVDPGGSGIGLAVVRELVTAHGGRVRADSDGTSGTTVTITLPLVPPSP